MSSTYRTCGLRDSISQRPTSCGRHMAYGWALDDTHGHMSIYVYTTRSYAGWCGRHMAYGWDHEYSLHVALRGGHVEGYNGYVGHAGAGVGAIGTIRASRDLMAYDHIWVYDKVI